MMGWERDKKRRIGGIRPDRPTVKKHRCQCGQEFLTKAAYDKHKEICFGELMKIKCGDHELLIENQNFTVKSGGYVIFEHDDIYDLGFSWEEINENGLEITFFGFKINIEAPKEEHPPSGKCPGETDPNFLCHVCNPHLKKKDEPK
jgi:hypothetical protein